MSFDQPHYRLRQIKSGNIGVDEDGWQVGFGHAGGDPLDRENKLGGITGRSGRLERFLGHLDGHRWNVGRQLQVNWSLLDPAAPQDSVDFPACIGRLDTCLSHGEIAVRAQHVDEIAVPQGMVQQGAFFDGT